LTIVLIIITVLYLLFLIPISTIYWWPQFWGAQSAYWFPWIHSLIITGGILGALWIQRLIFWIKNEIQSRSGPIYGSPSETHRITGGPDWQVNEKGQASRPEDFTKENGTTFVVPEDIIKPDPYQTWAKRKIAELRRKAERDINKNKPFH
jgi:hypothetical protein